jgi:ribosome-binding factor A
LVSKTRAIRIAERLHEELSKILLTETSDPRLRGITVTDVKVDRELAFADIYVCALDGEQRSREILAGLEHAQGFLRSELAHRMELRMFPRLRFHWDSTFERAEVIERLIDSIHQNDKPGEISKKKRKSSKSNAK